MKSRDRIKTAMDHKEADRIPIDFGAMRSTGISSVAYIKLKKALGLNKGLSRMYDFQQQLAYPEKEIREIFSIDTIDAGQAFLSGEENWREWTLNDDSKCLVPKYLNLEIDDKKTVWLKDREDFVLGKKPTTSLYANQSYWVYKHLEKIPESFTGKDLGKHFWAVPAPPWHLDIFSDNEYEIFINTIRKLNEETEYSVMLSVGCNLFEIGTWLRGMDNFLCDIYTDKKGTKRLLDALVEKNMVFLERVINGVGDLVDLFQFGDDLGSQGGPFMSPDIFKEIFEPGYKKMCDFVHQSSQVKVFLHSCGSIYKLIPSLIDAGVDVLNPVQTSAADMEPERLKKEFGKYITFWGGGCDTQNVLLMKNPREIKEDVKRRIEIFNKNGGFVFNQIHNILANVPPENIIAMFEAAYEFGRY